MKATLTAMGVTIAGADFNANGCQDFSLIVAKVAKSGAQAAFVAMGSSDTTAFVRQAGQSKLGAKTKIFGVEQPGDGVADARARGDQHHTDSAGVASIAFRRVHGGLLMANQDVAQPRFAMQGIVKRQGGAAGIAEDRVHAARHQGVQQDLGAKTLGGFHGLAKPEGLHVLVYRAQCTDAAF